MKELCITKSAIVVHKRAFLATNVSSIIFNWMSVKYKDPVCHYHFHSDW